MISSQVSSWMANSVSVLGGRCGWVFGYRLQVGVCQPQPLYGSTAGPAKSHHEAFPKSLTDLKPAHAEHGSSLCLRTMRREPARLEIRHERAHLLGCLNTTSAKVQAVGVGPVSCPLLPRALQAMHLLIAYFLLEIPIPRSGEG